MMRGHSTIPSAGVGASFFADMPEALTCGSGPSTSQLCGTFLDVGTHSAVPIVLLHPFGLDWRVWSPVANRMKHAFRVIAPDVAGHGSNREERPLTSIDDAGDAIVRLLDEQGLDRVVLVGCSMGGAIAQSVAVRHPGRVAALVLIATFAKGGEAFLERAAQAERDGDGSSQVASTLDRWFPAGPAVAQARHRRYAEMMLRAHPASGWSSAWRAMAAVDHRPGLSRLTMPCLTVAGERDVSTPVALLRSICDAIPHARHVTIAGAPHMLVLTHPDEVSDAIMEFVATAEARDG